MLGGEFHYGIGGCVSRLRKTPRIGIVLSSPLYLPDKSAATCPFSHLPSLNVMPTLQSATLPASSWLCLQCRHLNNSNMNRKRCSLCWAWRDGLAPLSAKGGRATLGAAASNVGLVNNNASCHKKNGAPNNASPCRGGSPMKRGNKRKSPSQGLGRVLCPLTPPSPPALHLMHQITASPPLECRGISRGFFGQALNLCCKVDAAHCQSTATVG
jgi:hypothetical protein